MNVVLFLLSCCDWNSSSLDCGSVLCLNVSIHPRAQVVDSMNKDLGYHTVHTSRTAIFTNLIHGWFTQCNLLGHMSA